jgi:PAS domain S-box-containing protein
MQHSTTTSPPADAGTILEHLPVGVALFEAHSLRLLTANAAYQSLLDPAWQQGRAIGHPLTEFFPQAEASGVVALFRQVVESGIPSKLDLSVVCLPLAPHATSWAWALSPIFDQAGEVMQVLLTVGNMTSQALTRQQAEYEPHDVIAAVRNSMRQAHGTEQKAQAALATLSTLLQPRLLAIYTPSAAGHVCTLLVAHPSSEPGLPSRLLQQDFFGRPAFLLKAGARRAPFITSLPHPREEKLSLEDAFWLRLQGARTLLCVPLWFQDQWEGMLVAALSDSLQLADTPIQTLIGCGTPLAEVLTHSRFSAALAQAQRRVSTILDHLPEGILLVEATTSTVSYANAVAAQLLGHALPDLIGRPLNESVGMRPDLSSPRQKLLAWNFALIYALSGETITSQECLVTRPDGSTAIILCSATPLRTPTGRITEAVLVFQDITAQKSLEQQKNEFFAMANHELRTPLTSILGYAELLQLQASSSGVDSFHQEALRHILQEGEHLRQLIQDLLDVSSLDYAQLKLKKGAHSLLGLATQQVNAFTHGTRTHRVSLSLHEVDSAEQLIGWVDPLRITQIMNNLLSNAIKYSPAGTEIEVEIHPFRDARGIPHEVQISVRDQGIGIEASDLPRIFERFYRGASLDGGTSGFGVGLYLTKALVQGHGGQIWAESERGEGSTFFVVLPLDAQSPSLKSSGQE